MTDPPVSQSCAPSCPLQAHSAARFPDSLTMNGRFLSLPALSAGSWLSLVLCWWPPPWSRPGHPPSRRRRRLHPPPQPPSRLRLQPRPAPPLRSHLPQPLPPGRHSLPRHGFARTYHLSPPSCGGTTPRSVPAAAVPRRSQPAIPVAQE